MTRHSGMTRALALISVLCAFSTCIQAQIVGPKQGTKRESRKAAANQSRPKYLTSPFDLSLQNLGPDFAGHDIKAILKAIGGSPALKPKSEFETTEEFQNRQASLASYPLYAGLGTESNLAFVLPADSARFSYDADAKRLKVSLDQIQKPLNGDQSRWNFWHESSLPDINVVTIRKESIGNRRYIGENALGASLTVEEHSYHEFDLAIGDGPWILHPDSWNPTPTFDFDMTKEEAVSLISAPRVLVVANMASPWYRAGSFTSDPTFDFPIKVTESLDCLEVVPVDIWVFNSKTGTVYRKLSDARQK